jgi:SAM-dependent methyltransferase
MNCRHCFTKLATTFVDLGFAPPSNAYLSESDLSKPEKYYPLKVRVCSECWLVQTEDYAQADELFSSDYAYFSGTSSTWVQHVRNYADEMVETLSLTRDSLVIEVASNDGHLLRNFVAKKIPCLGIEPTHSTAEASKKLGVKVIEEFFSESLASRLTQEGLKADLVIGNNVYAHVPDINDFTKGLKEVLKSGGTITLEFPHIQELIEHNQFDTIYHEHFSYLSLYTVIRIFESHGLRVWHAKRLTTHGGSLRVFGCHNDDPRSGSEELESILSEEVVHGLQAIDTYLGFQERAEEVKNSLLRFLLEKKSAGQAVVAYGAAAKGNTLLNFAGIKNDLITVVYDAAPSKQGRFLPGSHIPIRSPQELIDSPADNVLILPWNLLDEIVTQLKKDVPRPLHYVTAIPRLTES